MEALIEAKSAGRARHLGFLRAHRAAALAAMDRYDFDSVMFPVNFAMLLKDGLGPPVVEQPARGA